MSIGLIDDEYDWKNININTFLSMGNTPSGWSDFFRDRKTVELLSSISDRIDSVTGKTVIYPNINYVFRAFYLTPLSNLKAVIVGQDPYHNGSATGLCFSVKLGNSINPSLRNIYKELKQEGYNPEENGVLTHWARQGVLLLNMSLTVEKGNPGSHAHMWYSFSKHLIKYIDNNTISNKIHWLLFGRDAHQVKKYIQNGIVHCTSHPSPFSAHKNSSNIPAFLGSGVFRKVEDIQW